MPKGIRIRPEMADAIVAAHAAGESISAIAKREGLAKVSVFSLLVRLGAHKPAAKLVRVPGLTKTQDWYRRLKDDPARFAKWKARMAKERAKHTKPRPSKLSPEERAERRRGSARRNRQRIKEDAAKHEAYLEKQRAYRRDRYKRDPKANNAACKAWAKANPEKRKRIMAEWAQRNPEKVREASKRDYQKNREKRLADHKARNASPEGKRKNHERWLRTRDPDRERRKAYFQANKAKIRQRIKAWLDANPWMRTEYSRRRRARVKAAETGDRKAVLAFYKWVRTTDVIVCHLCGNEIPKGKRSVDHVLPLAKGGKHAIENLAPACQNCNVRKGHRV